jgi:exodeoxyribonuclease-3
MKIISWNVNGIRSVFRTTFRDWLKSADPDIVCLQETKADYTELTEKYTQIDGYYAYFNSSSLKKGHSGVAVYTKIKPLSVETKLGIPRFDEEGRCLKLTFKDFVLFNFYIPNGGRDKHDIPYKLEVYKQLLPQLESISNQNIILTGDFNIAHTELDVYYAKQNVGNTMFTQEERVQITKLLSLGYIDTFREKYPEKKAYTWWPYMRNLRERDIGWRIDYFFVSKSLYPLVQDAFMQREILGSDHGILGITLDKKIEIDKGPVYNNKKQEEPQSSLF